MNLRRNHSPAIAGAKAGFSTQPATGSKRIPGFPARRRRVENDGEPIPSPMFRDDEVVPMLKAAPGLRPIAVFEELCRRHPDLGAGTRQTLERRVRSWRAVERAGSEVIFRQEHPPGRMGLSDFTEVADLDVTIAARSSIAELYHFRLPFSASNTPMSCSAAKLRRAGGRATERPVGAGQAFPSNIAATVSRRPSAISTPTPGGSDEAVRSVLRHYGMNADPQQSRRQPRNGSIESAHGHLESARRRPHAARIARLRRSPRMARLRRRHRRPRQPPQRKSASIRSGRR